MIRSSACQPWQPDLPGHAGDRGDLLSYTTPWDTIQERLRLKPPPSYLCPDLSKRVLAITRNTQIQLGAPGTVFSDKSEENWLGRSRAV